MFKNILSFWKGREFLDVALDEFKVMLDNSQQMFDLVCRYLIENEDIPNIKDQVYTLDREINKNEKGIRKRVAEHLVLQPTVDVSECLVLMSVVKDAERLGDYCKNLYAVTEMRKKPIDKELFVKWFNGLDEELCSFFKVTKKAFMESDETIAKESWELKAKISTKCDEIIKQLFASNLPTDEAVCFTLIARHFKRLSSHLVNIATSVVLPIDQLDYFDEKHIGKEDR